MNAAFACRKLALEERYWRAAGGRPSFLDEQCSPTSKSCNVVFSADQHDRMLASLDAFTTAYIEAALWSSTDESRDDGGDPLDKNYSVEDIAPETLARMVADCAAFQAAHAADVAVWNKGRTSPDEQAGHDFWLTRNGHGCGFNDGDWPDPAATRLYAASKKFGEVWLVVGDDGQIHGHD